MQEKILFKLWPGLQTNYLLVNNFISPSTQIPLKNILSNSHDFFLPSFREKALSRKLFVDYGFVFFFILFCFRLRFSWHFEKNMKDREKGFLHLKYLNNLHNDTWNI